MDHSTVTEADIARSRADPRFKQVLLAKSLEQLLGRLYLLQKGASDPNPAGARELREGAIMAAQLADMIRSIDDKLRVASGSQA